MKKKLIIGAALSALALAAQAYEFDFTARVTYTDGSLSGVGTDTLINGHFTGDGPVNRYADFGRNDLTEYGFASGQVTAEVGGHTIVSSSPSIRIYDNLGGNVEDGFSMDSGYTLKVDDTVYADGGFGFNLTTVPGNTEVIYGLDLPTRINVADFDGHSSLTYGYMQRDGGQGGRIFGFQVLSVNVTSVPEPSTAGLMAIGLLAAAAVRRQRART